MEIEPSYYRKTVFDQFLQFIDQFLTVLKMNTVLIFKFLHLPSHEFFRGCLHEFIAAELGPNILTGSKYVPLELPHPASRNTTCHSCRFIDSNSNRLLRLGKGIVLWFALIAQDNKRDLNWKKAMKKNGTKMTRLAPLFHKPSHSSKTEFVMHFIPARQIRTRNK
jgi:hypothetical protein